MARIDMWAAGQPFLICTTEWNTINSHVMTELYLYMSMPRIYHEIVQKALTPSPHYTL